MSRGKSAFATWFCKECKKGNYITTYNKKEPCVEEKLKFCKKCRKKVPHKRKDSK